MKLTSKTALILLSLSFGALGAERQFIMFGGGGEPKDSNTTIFDTSLKKMSSFLDKNKWDHVVSYNGGHSETENILYHSFPKAQNKVPFNEVNYNAIINKYIKDINEGKYQAGNQIMIMIDTHGAIPTEGETTHNIAIGRAPAKLDTTRLSNTKTVSLDSLKALSELASKKGIKLGILDFSCHSGATLALADKNVCVISSSSPQHFGYSDFSEQFIDNMKPGKSLEDIFLETRRETTSTSYPMISTEEGRTINKDLYPSLVPFLYYSSNIDNKTSNKLADYLLDAGKNSCVRENQFTTLLKKLDAIKAAGLLNATSAIPEIDELKSLVKDYKSKQDQQMALLKKQESDLGFDHEMKFEAVYENKGQKITLRSSKTVRELLTTDFSKVSTLLARQLQTETSPEKRLSLFAAINLSSKEEKMANDLNKNNPQFKAYKEDFSKMLANKDDTYAIANQIAIKEKKLYDSVYSSIKKNQLSSPCKDFRL